MLAPKDPDNLQPPTLGRAIVGFVSSLAIVVGVFLLLGHPGWSDGAPDVALAGTFATPQPAAVAAGREYTFRFLEDQRVEVRAGERVLRAYYRVEHDHVIVETAEARGRKQAWRFVIAGDRLIGGGLVLTRR